MAQPMPALRRTMRITFKLYATLGEYLPEGAFENAVAIEAPEGMTPNAIIDRYHVPRKLVHLVLINGVYCDKGDRDRAVLHEGDTLAIWPPVAGG